jgi:long-chain acyl-CoA synthetase
VLTRDEALRRLTAEGEPFELIGIEAMGRKVRAFRNAPPTLKDLYATTRSDLPFLVYESERLTFEQVWRKSCTLAEALVSEFGVRSGDRVAISMRNYPEWVIAFNAVTSVGAVAVCMNALWQPAEMEYGLSNSGASVLIGDQERLDRFLAIDPPAKDIAVIAARTSRPPPAGVRTFEDVMTRAERDAMPDVPMAPDDDAIMLYTSGSTGHPKGAVSTHRNIISALLSWELDFQASVQTRLLPAPVEGAPQGGMLLGIPLFHVAGSHAAFLSSYRAQRRLVSMYKWDPEVAAELIERERITSFTAPAAVTHDLVEVARRTKRDLTSLATVGGGGSARAPEQVRAIDRAFANARPNTGWGMTETNAIGTGIIGEDYLSHPSSSGRVSAVLELRVVDPDGKVLPANERGELQVRGTSVMRGYWRRPDANAECFVGDWFRTGDVAYLDEDGFLYIVDRIKDLVIRGGENIGCGAVEAAFLEHPDVVEASAYGVPDVRLGEELAVTLYCRRPVPEAELRVFLEPRLAKFQIPRYIEYAAEPLPRIASGKILKRQLRDEAVARLKASGQV